MERALGNSIPGLTWLVYGFINSLWGFYAFLYMHSFYLNHEDNKIKGLMLFNIYSAFVTFILMLLFTVCVLTAKLYGVYISLNYCKRMAQMKRKKMK